MPKPFTGLLESYKTDVFDELRKGMSVTGSCIALVAVRKEYGNKNELFYTVLRQIVKIKAIFQLWFGSFRNSTPLFMKEI